MADVVLRDGTAVYLAPISDDHWLVPFEPLSAYMVHMRGSDEFVGVVSKVETMTHRKVGRLIAQTFHPVRWYAGLAGYYREPDGSWRCGRSDAIPAERAHRVGVEFYSRRDAIGALVRALHEAREEWPV
jgi:hypothetical protein